MTQPPVLRLQDWLSTLVACQNSDGGFPYFQGKRSSLEPTALAVLALESESALQFRSAAKQARNFLLSKQSSTGYWPITPEDKAPAWETPLVLIALNGDFSQRETCRLGINRYLEIWAEPSNTAGVTLDPRWRGWTWYPPTPGWVEPTSMALIAVNKLRALAESKLLEERQGDGQRFLIDRMSPEGGWNYGNSYVLGQALSSILVPTALAVLAFLPISTYQDRINQALVFLERNLEKIYSGLTLAWCILALSAYEKPVETPRKMLLSQWDKSAFLGNMAVLSLALLALNSTHDKHPFA
jgi:hypothetical protein